MLPLQGARVQSLVRELRSCKPRGAAKKKKNYKLLHHSKLVNFWCLLACFILYRCLWQMPVSFIFSFFTSFFQIYVFLYQLFYNLPYFDDCCISFWYGHRKGSSISVAYDNKHLFLVCVTWVLQCAAALGGLTRLGATQHTCLLIQEPRLKDSPYLGHAVLMAEAGI